MTPEPTITDSEPAALDAPPSLVPSTTPDRPPRWLGLPLGILDIGGGAVGLLLLGMAVVRATQTSALVICAMFALVYILGIWSGVSALQARSGWLEQNLLFWGLQVPIVSSPLLSYSVSSGAMVGVWVVPLELRVGANFWIGGQFDFTIMTDRPWAFGANLFALAVLGLLLRLYRAANRSN